MLRAVRACLIVSVLAAACSTPTLVGTEGDVSASPVALDFGRVAVGVTRTATLTLGNASKSAQDVVLATPAPFSSVAQMSLAGAGSTEASVVFSAATPGEHRATLVITTDRQRLEVALHAEAVALPLCAPSMHPCRETHADADTFECVTAPLADGTACSTACVPAGVCSRGDCLGLAPSCDDGNACTLDACSLELGCTHSDTACLAPDDPCQVSLCDPRTGCGTVDAADGTSCGSSDCTLAHVCIAGRCSARLPPNGAACGAASPCQAAGVCQNQTCVQPPPAVLPAVWTYAPALGDSVTFPGVADASGNLYWFEQRATDAFVVSVDRDGQPRFRQSIGQVPTQAQDSALSVMGGDTLVIFWTTFKSGPGRIEARATSDGALRWSHSLVDLREQLAFPGGNFWVMGAVEGANGSVVANLRSNNGGASWTSWLAGFESRTGLLLWSRRYDYLSELISDEAGNVYSYVELFEHRLFSVDPAGLERWNLLVGSSQMPGAAPPVMVVGQSLMTAYPASVRTAATGAVVTSSTNAFFTTHGGPPAVMSLAQMVVPDGNSICSRSMTGFVTGPWAARWSWADPAECIEDVVLTSRNSTFFSTRVAGQKVVRELDATGVPLYRCAVAAGGFNPASVLHAGRWVTFDSNAGAVKAFDLHGAAPAASGWVSGQGSAARNGRPK